MHDANKICLIISLIGKDIGIPSEYSDEKILKDSYFYSLVDENAKQEILKSFLEFYYTKSNLLHYPDRAQLIQDCKSAMIKIIYDNLEDYPDLKSFKPVNEGRDLEILKHIESVLTERDPEDKFKISEQGIRMLIYLYAPNELDLMICGVNHIRLQASLASSLPSTSFLPSKAKAL
jgi:hypothetical protein